MKAIVVDTPKDPRSLHLCDVPEPTVREGERLIAVRATAINRADVLQAQGKYPPPPGASEILGLECAGVEVESGRRVCALLSGGGYAERVAAPAGSILALPEAMSFTEAAAIPEVWLTAYLNLFIEGGLAAGETVMIHAAASGVGTAAIQLAKRAGARVIATTRSAHKFTALSGYGADAVVSTESPDFIDQVRGFTAGRGVDVILDALGGGPALEKNLSLLAIDGRLVIIGLMAGSRAEIALDRMLARRQRLIGSTLRSRSVEAKAALVERFAHDAWPDFAAGRLKPVIDRVFKLEHAAEAMAHVMSNQTIGKVVLEVGGA